MREFSWNVFAVTGNIDAYLLYKDVCGVAECEEEETNENEEDLEYGCQ